MPSHITRNSVAAAFAGMVVYAAITVPVDAQQAEAPRPATSPAPLDAFKSGVLPFLKKYCLDCHSGTEPDAGFKLDSYRTELEAGRDENRWMQVLEKLEKGEMPPADHEPKPTEPEKRIVLDWIDRTFIHVDCSKFRDPGRVTARRLNRVEYNNTIRDLVGVDFQPAKDFPSDDVGYGFDNIGDVLTLSPLLMEKYMDAAEKIAAKALTSVDLTRPHVVRLEGGELKGSGAAKLNEYGFHMISSKGEVSGEFNFPFDGEYIIRARVTADQAGPEPVRMAYKIDGKLVKEFKVKRHREAGFFGKRVPVRKGKFPVTVEFLNDFYDPNGKDPEHRDRNLGVHLIEVEGPFGVSPSQARGLLPETHRRIVFTVPDKTKSPEACAREIFQRFATRAYRRPVTDDELGGLVKLVSIAMKSGESFDNAIQLGVQAVLVSPNFLFRFERDVKPNDPKAVHAVADYELATRLSYFLWSTMPDDELFSAAERGELRKPDVLEAQARRMLEDPKSQALVENFASQWLNLRNLDVATPNQKVFEGFNDELRADMRRETEMLFETVLREDLSIVRFLDADFTFVNERLAKLYEIPGITGTGFQRVSLTDGKRAGVVSHASVLTLTSDPTKTSPVKRGKWVLENLLGAAPPPPPAQVPDLAETKKTKPDATLREQMELHRSNSLCASCHKVMDPIGLSLENFDGIGRFRDKYGDKPIDASGTLPTGETIQNAQDLVRILKGREREFIRHFVRTLLTYSLGRGLEYYDKCAVDSIAAAALADGGKLSRVVVEIVRSEPFLMRRGDGGQE